MYAIVEIAGQQFKVEEGNKIFVHRLDAEGGKKIEFNNVLLIEEEGKIMIGEPVIKDAFVEGIVLDQVKGDKIIIFKKKRKKGYRIKNGHRQRFTHVEIISINGKVSTKKQTVRKEAAVIAEEPVKTEKKSEAKKRPAKKTVAESKQSSEKKASEKKPVTKKPVLKKKEK